MKKYILFVLTTVFAFFLISSFSCFADIVYHTDMKPIAERPRVCFNSADIPVILENAQKEPNKSQWDRFLFFAGEKMPEDMKNGSVFTAQAASCIESKAFYYAIYGDESTGRAAIDELTAVLEGNTGVWYDYNSLGEAIYLIGVVYDWCYPLVTEAEKTYFQSKVVSLASESDISWPPSNGSSIMSHSAEGILMRDLLSAAIAMYGDNDEIYQNVMGRYFSEYVDARKFMYESGYFFPGLHYLSYRYQWEIISAHLIDAAYGIEKVYGEKQKDVVYGALYSQRPDGSFLRSGDNAFNNHYPGSRYYINLRALLYTASYFDDPYINSEAQKFLEVYNFNQTNVNQTVTPVEFLIMSKPGIALKPVAELPLTRFFSSPYGAMIARTGWEEGLSSGAVVAEMKVVENQFNEHQHLDAGAFQIYYKGGLANDTGYYQAADNSSEGRDTLNNGSTVYAGAHDNNYQSRTIAHNCMLIYDPSETFVSKQTTPTSYPIENDGGQERKNGGHAPSSITAYNLSSAKWRSGRVMGAEYGESPTNPDWSYLKGDIANAYSDKVSGYERSFMFLNLKEENVPAALVVFDRVESSKASFKKTWLLHTKNAPEVNGNRIAAEVTGNGYGGRLTLDALLPKADNLSVSVTEGGEGDAWVNGTNYFASVLPGRINEGGGSRIEISPKAEQNEDFFLNVIQVSDAGSDFSYDVTPVETNTHAGAVISDRVVLFAKQKQRTSDDISFEFSSDEECLITVADCKEGTWNVYDEHGLYEVVSVSESGGVAAFYGYGGSYTLEHNNGSEAGSSNVGFDPDSNHIDYIASRTFNGSGALSVQSSHFSHAVKSGVSFKAPDDSVYELTPVSAGSGNFIHNANRASSDYGSIKSTSIESEFMLNSSSSRLGLSLCAYSEASDGTLSKENWLYNLISVSKGGFYVLNSNAVGGTYVFDTSVIPANGRLKIADSVSLGRWHKIRIVFSAEGRFMDFYFDSYEKVRVPVSAGAALENGLKIFSLTGKSDAVSGSYAPIYADNVSYITAFAMSENSSFDLIENSEFEPLYALSDLYTYYVSGSECTLTGIKEGIDASLLTKLIIPDTIGSYGVCAVADGAFSECTSISELVILTELKSAGESFAPDNLKIMCSPATKNVIGKSTAAGYEIETGVYADSHTVYPLCDGAMLFKARHSGNRLTAVETEKLTKFKAVEVENNNMTYYFRTENQKPLSVPITY